MTILSVTFFTSLVLIIFILSKYTYLTRKALAETGHIPPSNHNKFIYQDIACIVIGLGVGLGGSSIISTFDLSEDTMDLLIYGTIAIFCGIGLLIAHFIRRAANRQ